MLSAANAALPVPGDGLARLWQAATVLREHRGDGHFAALAAADIDGCEAVALRCLMDMRRENLQPVRGWTDEAWDDALGRLAARGWVDRDGALTSAGREAHAAVENATDWAAARPWDRLGPAATAEIAAALTPTLPGLRDACFPSPAPSACPRPARPGDGAERGGCGTARSWADGHARSFPRYRAPRLRHPRPES